MANQISSIKVFETLKQNDKINSEFTFFTNLCSEIILFIQIYKMYKQKCFLTINEKNEFYFKNIIFHFYFNSNNNTLLFKDMSSK